MRLFILGANGRTGTELVDLALKQGHQVTAFVRSPEKLAIVDTRLHVIKGSLGDVEGMSQAMQGQDAVFSTLGPKPGEVFTALEKRAWTMEKLASNALSAMQAAKVERVVVFSSAGLFPGQNLFVKLLRALAHNHMEDLRRMEKAVTESPLSWTIARPTWLAKSPDENYRAQIGALPPGAAKLSFRALARFMLDAVEKGLYQRQILGLGK